MQAPGCGPLWLRFLALTSASGFAGSIPAVNLLLLLLALVTSALRRVPDRGRGFVLHLLRMWKARGVMVGSDAETVSSRDIQSAQFRVRDQIMFRSFLFFGCSYSQCCTGRQPFWLAHLYIACVIHTLLEMPQHDIRRIPTPFDSPFLMLEPLPGISQKPSPLCFHSCFRLPKRTWLVRAKPGDLMNDPFPSLRVKHMGKWLRKEFVAMWLHRQDAHPIKGCVAAACEKI